MPYKVCKRVLEAMSKSLLQTLYGTIDFCCCQQPCLCETLHCQTMASQVLQSSPCQKMFSAHSLYTAKFLLAMVLQHNVSHKEACLHPQTYATTSTSTGHHSKCVTSQKVWTNQKLASCDSLQFFPPPAAPATYDKALQHSTTAAALHPPPCL